MKTTSTRRTFVKKSLFAAALACFILALVVFLFARRDAGHEAASVAGLRPAGWPGRANGPEQT